MALLGALQAICELQQVAPGDLSASASAENLHGLLAAAFQVLSERRAAALRGAAFPKFCIARLTAALEQLRTGAIRLSSMDEVEMMVQMTGQKLKLLIRRFCSCNRGR